MHGYLQVTMFIGAEVSVEQHTGFSLLYDPF